MEKGKDCDQNFSLTPGIAIARIITSIAAANALELHTIHIEQAFLQADKLLEGVNGRYFINPTSKRGAQMPTTRILCMKCCDLYTEIPRRQEPYIKSWMPCLRGNVSILSDLKNPCGKGLPEENI
jgi:hypothetical protein